MRLIIWAAFTVFVCLFPPGLSLIFRDSWPQMIVSGELLIVAVALSAEAMGDIALDSKIEVVNRALILSGSLIAIVCGLALFVDLLKNHPHAEVEALTMASPDMV